MLTLIALFDIDIDLLQKTMAQREKFLTERWALLQNKENILEKLISSSQSNTREYNTNRIFEKDSVFSTNLSFSQKDYSKLTVRSQIQKISMKNIDMAKIKKEFQMKSEQAVIIK